jgi:alkanesulfonate monooxygenase SsuD/methylene tetrahydromethanopterin reductase-like flavin-dependent oxidoreductase (luciferase family)
MRFDYFCMLCNGDPSTRPWDHLLGDIREQVELVDQGGFDGVWVGEHHFDIEGVDQCPNPVLLASDLAGRTTNVRLGLGVANLPLWHPIRFAEDVAMLDHFSGGRVDVALGRGLLARDIIVLNPDADRRYADRSIALFREQLAIVRQAWAEEGWTFDGEFHRFPRPGIRDAAVAWFPRDPRHRSEQGDVAGLTIVPRTLQQPAPPLFTVSESRDGFVMAGQEGLAPITWLPIGSALDGLLNTYRETVAATTGETLASGERCGLMRVCLVCDTDEEALELMRPTAKWMMDALGTIRGPRVFLDPEEEIADDELAALTPVEVLAPRGHLLAGSPATVRAQIEQLRERYAIEHLLLFMNPRGIAHEATMRSIELFARDVAPHVGALEVA